MNESTVANSAIGTHERASPYDSELRKEFWYSLLGARVLGLTGAPDGRAVNKRVRTSAHTVPVRRKGRGAVCARVQR